MKKTTLLFNKYVLTIIFFVVWMLFFDQKDIFSTLKKKKELKTLVEKKQYYISEIEATKKELTDFQQNTTAIEKFAREKYMLKKDGEDIFIIEDSLQFNNSSKQ
jgi:cell division protein FtsB